jgi:molecular chaperone GrpE
MSEQKTKDQIENEVEENAEAGEQPIAETVEGEVMSAEEIAELEAAEEAEETGDRVAAGNEPGEEIEPELSEIEQAQQIISHLESELDVARAEAAASLDQMQRAAAEFQNSKRRQEKQLNDAIARSAERVITQLLPVLDDFDLAFKNVPEDISDEDEAWLGGFRQIQKKLMILLENEGVEMIPTTGEFDPNRHEAISSEPNEEVESGHIIDTLRVGYEHKGRVLRPALVRVAM